MVFKWCCCWYLLLSDSMFDVRCFPENQIFAFHFAKLWNSISDIRVTFQSHFDCTHEPDSFYTMYASVQSYVALIFISLCFTHSIVHKIIYHLSLEIVNILFFFFRLDFPFPADANSRLWFKSYDEFGLLSRWKIKSKLFEFFYFY